MAEKGLLAQIGACVRAQPTVPAAILLNFEKPVPSQLGSGSVHSVFVAKYMKTHLTHVRENCKGERATPTNYRRQSSKVTEGDGEREGEREQERQRETERERERALH